MVPVVQIQSDQMGGSHSDMGGHWKLDRCLHQYHSHNGAFQDGTDVTPWRKAKTKLESTVPQSLSTCYS